MKRTPGSRATTLRGGAETRTERIVSRVFARGDFGTRRRRAETRAAPAARRRARLRLGRVRVGARRARTDGERRRERRRNRPAGFFRRARRRRVGKNRADFCPVRRGLGGVRVRRDPASLRGGRARGGRPARPRVPGGVGRADARSARGGFQTGRADGVARARARVGRAVRRRRGGGGQETRDGDHRRGDGRRRAVCRLGHSRRERERERERRKARAVPGPSRALLRDVPVRFRAGRRVGVRGRAPDPVARRGERVAQPEARQRAARRRPVPALRETRGQVN